MKNETRKVYGYARVSTKKQSISRQINNIENYDNNAIIFQEKFTGTKLQGRVEFQKLLKRVKSGDTIVFDSVSRMSRNAEEGVALYEELMEKGIELVFLKEPYINTETYKSNTTAKIELMGTDEDILLSAMNEYMKRLARKQIVIAFEQSQKEIDDISQRTKEGMEFARRLAEKEGREWSCGIAKGTKLVTKKSLEKKELIKKYSKDFNGTLKDVEVMKLVGLARNTYYKYKKEMLEEE